MSIIVFIVTTMRDTKEPPKTKPKKPYPLDATDQEKIAWVCKQNQKRIDKINRKYK